MKRINFPLCIGITVLIVLLLASLFPKLLTDIDPTTTSPFRTVKTARDDGFQDIKTEAHPAKPDSENILGTDELGRDIYSRLIHGTKATLTVAILVVLFRLLVAVPIGLAAGVGVKSASFLIKLFNTVFTAIPILFISFFILNIEYINNLSMKESTIVFAVLLSVLGWSKLGKQIEEKASKIMNEEFIEGEIAVGKSKIQIAVQNMLPHLIPSLISFIFLEIGLVIFLLAQLSILGIFIGPRIPLKGMEWGIRWMMGSDPEWASMLAQMPRYNRAGRYWVGLYPALAFAVGILGFNLTGEGLRIEFEKRNSKVVSTIRNFGFIFSPKVYVLQLRKFKEYSKPVFIKTLSIILVLVYVFMPAPKSLYAFQPNMAIDTLEHLMQPEYEGRLTGYEGNRLAGEYIIEKLQEYGLEPYDGENYIQTFPLDWAEGQRYITLEEAIINLKDNNGDISTYKLYDDFDIAAFNTNYINEEEVDDEGYVTFTGVSLNNLDDDKVENPMYVNSFDNFRDLWINIRQELIRSIPSYVSFAVLEDDSYPSIRPVHTKTNKHIIVPKGELLEKLKSDNYNVEFKVKEPKAGFEEGRNIFAVLPGKDWDKPNDSHNKKEVIIIGAAYDGSGVVNNNISAISSAKASINLEIARVLSKVEEGFDKTIIFAFWDGESALVNGSAYYGFRDKIFVPSEHIIYYFDIGFVDDKDIIRLDIQSPESYQVDTYDMINDIHKRFKKKNVKFVSKPSNSGTFFGMGEHLSLKISVQGDNYYHINTDKDTIENINSKQLENIGQFFIDLITMNEHFK